MLGVPYEVARNYGSQGVRDENDVSIVADPLVSVAQRRVDGLMYLRVAGVFANRGLVS